MTDYRWVAVDFGGPEVLRRVAVNVPRPAHGQVRFDVRACGINPADAKHIAPGQDRSLLPLTIGMEVSGVVSAAGGGTDFSVGDEVVTRTSSGYATAVTVPASGVYRKPAPLTFTEAANLLLADTTAADLLHTSGAAPGETVLLHGAAGAVGVSALHQARLHGVLVIGTASKANFPFVERFGGVPVEYGPGCSTGCCPPRRRESPPRWTRRAAVRPAMSRSRWSRTGRG